jgi:hypothetical protein
MGAAPVPSAAGRRVPEPNFAALVPPKRYIARQQSGMVERTPSENISNPELRRKVYLFQWRETDLFAISPDPAGSNIPAPDEHGGWTKRGSMTLGVLDPLPVPLNPEPVLRALAAHGFFTWERGQTLPFGTSQ